MNKKILSEILDDSKAARKNNKFLNQPQNLFLLTGVLVLILPLFFWGQSVVIHIDKPRIFISGEFFIYVVSGLLILGWMIYMFTHSMLATQFLSWVHIGITLGALLFFILTSSWFFKLNASSNLESFFIKTLIVEKEYLVNITSKFSILFILGQLAYLVNLILGLLGKRY